MENNPLERLKARREFINTRISQNAARKLSEQRRLDTRRKIIAGAMLLAAVERDRAMPFPTDITLWWKSALRTLRESDRWLFEPPKPPPPPARNGNPSGASPS